MPFFQNDPLSRERRQNLIFLLGVGLILAVIALLFLGQAWLDKRRLLSIGQKAPIAMTALPDTSPAPASGSLDQPRLTPAPPPSQALSPPADPATLLLRDALQLLEQKQFDAALEKVNAALQVAPKNPDAYGLRGGIYAEKKLWDQAEKDFQTAIQIDDNNVRMKFDLAEIEFMQKKYDAARPGFVALKQDSAMGDLAAYKVFLSDLFGGHEEVAANELAGFNQVGSNASYYFANAAWSLYHHKTEQARGWLMSAANIFAPNKFRIYAASLIDLGYMPLPPPPQR
jgi:tetratricopeptide (TPR) repeat protein